MKKPLLFLVLILLSSYLFAQPANNNCGASVPALTIGTPVTGTIASATNDGGTACPGTERGDVWYKFVALKTSYTLTLTNPGANFTNAGLQVLNGCGGTSLVCGGSSITVTGLTVTSTYYVRVFTTTNPVPANNAGFTLTLSNNNDCADATTVTPAGSCTALANQSLYLAAADAGSPANPYSTTTNDVWYKFTVPADVTTVRVYLPARGSNINNNNTFIEAFNADDCGDISTGTSIGTANNTGNGLTLVNVLPGAQYYFRVFTSDNTGSNANNWSFSVCITYDAAPGNNECNNATNLTIGNTTTNQRLSNATASSGIPAGCATDSPDDDVWYRFTANSTTAKVTVLPSTALGAAGVSVQIFSGTCGSLASIACGTRNSAFASGLTPGTQYYVRVYTGGEPGTGAAGGLYNGTTFSIAVTVPTSSIQVAGRMKEVFKQTVLSASNLLLDPWDVTMGPDNYLWITEAKGYRLYRMDPNTGERSTVLDLNPNSTFFSSAADKAFNLQYDASIQSGQGGFAGLALHPKLLDPVSPVNSVYVSYIYTYRYSASNNEGKFFTNRVVKFTYNPVTNRLESPEAVCDTIPGSSDHNSQRMVIAPVDGVPYLFYAAGDMGSGQFENRNRPQKAQLTSSYEGKILRFNLASDGETGLDKWIPNDNPFNDGGIQSAVWVKGIRNNQGFVYDTSTQKLYGSSHGPYSDDEINIIERGRNYGHPMVIGYKNDGNYNGSAAGATGGSTCPNIISEITNAATIGTSYKDPLFSGYPRTQAQINSIYNNNGDNKDWPSEGWSGIDIYKANYAPGWKNSLIVASLKWGRVLRLKLYSTGDSLLKIGGYDTVSNFDSRNRYRDIAFSKDGKDMFVIMDRSSATSGPSSDNPSIVDCPGCVQKYTFLGYNDAGGKSTIPESIDVTTPPANNICTPATTVTINDDNNNLWVPITGPDGNIMAEINANGQNLGIITSSFYKNAGPLRQLLSKRYLNRNITITPETQPSLPVGIRLYISKDEFDALVADPASSVEDTVDLKILKNTDNCRPTIGSSTTVIPTTAYKHGDNGLVLQGQISSFSSFYFGGSLITLPLELLSFKGELVNNATLLNWETSNEKNTDQFIIERSIDGRNFEAIGTVAAAGNSNENLFYSYTDNTVTSLPVNIVYYRLRILNLDGKFDYSSTIKIALSDLVGRLSVFPSPASAEISMSVLAGTTGDARWKLVDNAGAVVMSGVTKLKPGRNIIPLNIQKLAAGIYHISLTGAGVDQNVKFQKL